ncbi:MAG: xanthine dehydrogenase family protein molybdopterin-binding subunit [Phycisphaeraceae bacterium]|nr:xanthine dehydrogenase family protein molybdopterin-binding subunit [Phycisphaeraceae bacterium]
MRDHTPTDMPTRNRPMNRGASLADDASRLDAVAKVTGAAKYARDMYPADCLFVGFVRCPVGSGQLAARDEAAARAVPGVLEVEIERDEGRYHGQPVGHIVAESKTALRRAMRALDARWTPGPCSVEIEQAAGEPPQTQGDIAQLLERAQHVLDATYETPVQTHSPLETHGGMAIHHGDRAELFSSTQGTSAAADGIEDQFGLPRAACEIHCEYVGGGFGSKLNGAGREGAIAARMSAKYRRPVSCFTDRDEDHLDTGNRPSSRARVRIGFQADGTVLGGHIHTWGGVGVARGGGGCAIPSNHYDLGRIQKTSEDVQLNAGAPRPFRAPGWPQGKFAEELMLDEICAACGLDPVEMRLRLERSDDRRDMIRTGARLIGWNQRRPNGSGGAIRRGFGLGTTDWPRFPRQAEAEVIVNRDGSVEVRTGTQDIGTGMRTVAGVLAADRLGCGLERVNVRIGHSSLPPGPGSGGSMTSHNTAPAIIEAALQARNALLDAVGDRLGIPPDELSIQNDHLIHDQEPMMDWAEACAKLPRDAVIGRASSDTPQSQRHVGEGHSQGVQFVDLRVDTQTGIVHVDRIIAIQSCGQVVMRKGAESQIIGGVIQGVSYALFEHKIHDKATGTMVNPNLEWYKILGSADMPRIEPVLWTKGQTGVRSLGEPPTIPTAGAIACAVFNAIGRPVRSLPITPDKVLAALEGGGR